MNRCTMIGLRVDHRRSSAVQLQSALTGFGCRIKLRVGLHETCGGNACSDEGIILLLACGEPEELEQMKKAFDSLDGVRAKAMELD